ESEVRGEDAALFALLGQHFLSRGHFDVLETFQSELGLDADLVAHLGDIGTKLVLPAIEQQPSSHLKIVLRPADPLLTGGRPIEALKLNVVGTSSEFFSQEQGPDSGPTGAEERGRTGRKGSQFSGFGDASSKGPKSRKSSSGGRKGKRDQG
ncbi:unnamed protein product, partial [Amoebophrya sp. A25]